MNAQELIQHVTKIAKEKHPTVVICEGWDERVIQAAAEILAEDICDIILLGDETEIKNKAKDLNVDISKANIRNPKTDEKKDEYAKQLQELRKHKGMTEEDAKKLIEDVNYFGCMLAKLDEVDSVCGSCICPTADLMRPAFQILGKKEGYVTVSEVSIIEHKGSGNIYFMSDFSLNIEPGVEELAQIAINAAEAVKLLGIEPKVAMLSFSTKGSGENPILQPIRDALAIVKQKMPDLVIDGELQGDAAVKPDSAKRKCPDSPIQGDANVLIYPNLTASNIACHLLYAFAPIEFLATMLMGTPKPVTIYGRSASKQMVKNLTICNAMQV